MSDGIQKYKFKVSVPMSVNSIYKSAFSHGKAHFYLDTKAKEAKESLAKDFMIQRLENKCPHFEDVIVIMEVFYYNIRVNRDLDNTHKMLQDAIADSQIIDNDYNIIPRPIWRIKNKEKEQYLIVYLYEAKGIPSVEDMNIYFPWLNEVKENGREEPKIKW